MATAKELHDQLLKEIASGKFAGSVSASDRIAKFKGKANTVTPLNKKEKKVKTRNGPKTLDDLLEEKTETPKAPEVVESKTSETPKVDTSKEFEKATMDRKIAETKNQVRLSAIEQKMKALHLGKKGSEYHTEATIKKNLIEAQSKIRTSLAEKLGFPKEHANHPFFQYLTNTQNQLKYQSDKKGIDLDAAENYEKYENELPEGAEEAGFEPSIALIHKTKKTGEHVTIPVEMQPDYGTSITHPQTEGHYYLSNHPELRNVAPREITTLHKLAGSYILDLGIAKKHGLITQEQYNSHIEKLYGPQNHEEYYKKHPEGNVMEATKNALIPSFNIKSHYAEKQNVDQNIGLSFKSTDTRQTNTGRSYATLDKGINREKQALTSLGYNTAALPDEIKKAINEKEEYNKSVKKEFTADKKEQKRLQKINEGKDITKGTLGINKVGDKKNIIKSAEERRASLKALLLGK